MNQIKQGYKWCVQSQTAGQITTSTKVIYDERHDTGLCVHV